MAPKTMAEFAVSLGAEIAGREIIPDERVTIEERLRHWADQMDCELVLTTGGTGFANRDVTPEATIPEAGEGIREGLAHALRLLTPR